MVGEAKGTLSDLKTRHWSTLLLMLRHQFVTFLLCETLGNVDTDIGLDAITGRRSTFLANTPAKKENRTRENTLVDIKETHCLKP